jgi:hypothetical protein
MRRDGARVYGGRWGVEANISGNAPGRNGLRQLVDVRRTRDLTKIKQIANNEQQQINDARSRDLIFRSRAL